jgi:hypothetical protein
MATQFLLGVSLGLPHHNNAAGIMDSRSIIAIGYSHLDAVEAIVVCLVTYTKLSRTLKTPVTITTGKSDAQLNTFFSGALGI